jgi:hypothetical protein
MELARWNSSRSLMGKRSSLREYKRSNSSRYVMSCTERTDDDDDASCLSAHYQNNIACQDMTATVLNSNEEWLRFKQAMQKTPARTNSAVLQHMHSAVLQHMQAESTTKIRAKHQNQQSKGTNSKPEVPGEIFGAAGTPSYNGSNEHIVAQRARTQSEDEDERQWHRRGSIADTLNGEVWHPAKPPCTKPGRYSSKKNPEKPGELICDFGPRRPRVLTRPWARSRSPSPPDLVSSVTSSARSSITSVASLEAAIRGALPCFHDDSNSNDDLLEDFGTRSSQKRPSFTLFESV